MNLTLLSAMRTEKNHSEETVKLLSHVLNAQIAWLSRLQGKAISIGVWDQYEKEALERFLEENNKEWQAYLAGLDEENLKKGITYRTFKGEEFTNTIEDILYQVLNHATHHRAQISTLLRQQDITPPPTDYIFYLRS